MCSFACVCVYAREHAHTYVCRCVHVCVSVCACMCGLVHAYMCVLPWRRWSWSSACQGRVCWFDCRWPGRWRESCSQRPAVTAQTSGSTRRTLWVTATHHGLSLAPRIKFSPHKGGRPVFNDCDMWYNSFGSTLNDIKASLNIHNTTETLDLRVFRCDRLSSIRLVIQWEGVRCAREGLVTVRVCAWMTSDSECACERVTAETHQRWSLNHKNNAHPLSLCYRVVQWAFPHRRRSWGLCVYVIRF